MKLLKYPSINGLRAISILFVIIGHLVRHDEFRLHFFSIDFLKPFTEFISDGQIGVNVFFVISGFLITSLMIQEESSTQSVSIKNFYIRRILRIFPAYFFLLLVYFILQLFKIIYISDWSWFTAITYTKYFNWNLDWYTGHGWSLSIEEHFYFFWPLIFISGNKSRKYFAILFILLVPVIRFYLHFYPINWMNNLTIFLRIDSIATGAFFALYKYEILKITNKNLPKIFYLSVLILILVRYFPDINKFHLGFIIVPFGSTNGTIANISIALIMMYSVFGPKGLWYHFLNSRILNYIGLLSYSIYLWQQIFISHLNFWIIRFPQNLIFIFIVAAFSYHVIEKPFLKLKHKFATQPK